MWKSAVWNLEGENTDVFAKKKTTKKNSPCQNGSNVCNEPLCGVEAQDANPVIAL